MEKEPDLFSDLAVAYQNSPKTLSRSKTFNVFHGSIVPPRSLEGVAIAHDCSDMFAAKVITVSGHERNYVVRYDFRDKKWISPAAGLKEVIEYYTEKEVING